MNASLIERLRAQIGGPRDGALLRFALGRALLDAGEPALARTELHAALVADPGYSAAWRALGDACVASGDTDGAADAWTRGIAAALQRGDAQAAREMQVFLRRLQRVL